MMMRTLFKRDWIKYLIWVIALLAYAASGAGKFELAMNSKATAASMYSLFENPALVALFGPTAVKHATDFTAASAFGGIMPLMTVVVFAVVSIIYVVNRTRKEEDEGIAELLRSFQIGKLANTTAVVIELLLLHIIMSLALAGSLAAQHVAGMPLSSNLLFSFSIGAQGFLWGIVALVMMNIFPDAGGAKGASIGILGALYILRMYSDIKAESLSWLNPLSWSYLTDAYVKDNWLPVILTLLLAAILLALSYLLEINRDVTAGYLPEGNGKAHAGFLLKTFTGFTLRQQRTATIGWLLGIFVMGITYGSMIGQIGNLIGSAGSNNYMSRAMGITEHATGNVMTQDFLMTVYLVISLLSVCFAVTSLQRIVSEERHNRLEQLYSMPLSRTKLYLTYTVIAWVLGALAQFIGILGIYLVQMGNKNALSFGTLLSGGMVSAIGTFFILGLLGLLIAYLPRLSSLIWAYIGFSFFIGVIGNMLNLSNNIMNLDVYHNLTKVTTKTVHALSKTATGYDLNVHVNAQIVANWSSFWMILILSLVFVIIGLIGYRRRDIISG